jgi:hypothetical protein
MKIAVALLTRSAVEGGAKVGPIEDKIGRGEPHPRPYPKAHAAQGGITLGPEQGDLGTRFSVILAAGVVVSEAPNRASSRAVLFIRGNATKCD